MVVTQDTRRNAHNVVLLDLHDMVRATLPEPEIPALETLQLPIQRLERDHAHTMDVSSPSEPSGVWAVPNTRHSRYRTGHLQSCFTSTTAGKWDYLRDASPMVTESQ
jgi:hypothetical protein